MICRRRITGAGRRGGRRRRRRETQSFSASSRGARATTGRAMAPGLADVVGGCGQPGGKRSPPTNFTTRPTSSLNASARVSPPLPSARARRRTLPPPTSPSRMRVGRARRCARCGSAATRSARPAHVSLSSRAALVRRRAARVPGGRWAGHDTRVRSRRRRRRSATSRRRPRSSRARSSSDNSAAARSGLGKNTAPPSLAAAAARDASEPARRPQQDPSAR